MYIALFEENKNTSFTNNNYLKLLLVYNSLSFKSEKLEADVGEHSHKSLHSMCKTMWIMKY